MILLLLSHPQHVETSLNLSFLNPKVVTEAATSLLLLLLLLLLWTSGSKTWRRENKEVLLGHYEHFYISP